MKETHAELKVFVLSDIRQSGQAGHCWPWAAMGGHFSQAKFPGQVSSPVFPELDQGPALGVILAQRRA